MAYSKKPSRFFKRGRFILPLILPASSDKSDSPDHRFAFGPHASAPSGRIAGMSGCEAAPRGPLRAPPIKSAQFLPAYSLCPPESNGYNRPSSRLPHSSPGFFCKSRAPFPRPFMPQKGGSKAPKAGASPSCLPPSPAAPQIPGSDKHFLHRLSHQILSVARNDSPFKSFPHPLYRTAHQTSNTYIEFKYMLDKHIFYRYDEKKVR